MNSDFPQTQHEELEARLTALLLGELSVDEAAAVRLAIEQDPELAELHERLKHTIDLVREAASSPVEQTAAQATPLRLSAEHRQRLLQHFRTAAPKELASPRRRETPWFVPMSIAAALVAMIGSVALLPGFKGLSERANTSARRAGLLDAKTVDGSEGIVDSSFQKEVDPPVTAAGSDNGRTVSDFTVQAGSLQVPKKALNLAESDPNARPAPDEQNAVASTLIVAGKLIAEGETGGKPIAATVGGVAPITGAPIVQTAPANNTPALNLSEPPIRLNERSETFRVDAKGSPALGDTPLVGSLFQTTHANDKNFNGDNKPDLLFRHTNGDLAAWYMNGTSLTSPIAAGALTNSRIALPQQTTPQITADPLLAGRTAGPQRAGSAPKIGLQGGSPPSGSQYAQVTDRNPFELKPLPTEALKENLGQQRESGIVAFSSDGTSLESFARGLAVPSVQDQPGSQPELPESENRHLQTLAPSKAPSLSFKEEQTLSRLGNPKLGKNTDTNADRPAVPNRGEQGTAALKMDPVLMMRYGLLRPGSAESKSKGAVRDDESLQQIARVSGAKTGKVPPVADAALPKSAVTIVDLAPVEPEKNPSLFDRLRRKVTGGVERAARIEVGKEATDTAPILMDVQNPTGYDPYFVQPEFEKIRSKRVLYQVIEKLNLNEAWARKAGAGEKLNDAETYQLLLKRVDVRQLRDPSQIEIRVKSDKPDEAALIANTIAEVYRDSQSDRSKQASEIASRVLHEQLGEQEKKIARAQKESNQFPKELSSQSADIAPPKPISTAPVPQPEIQTRENVFSTFSLNVSDVSFKLAAASLEKGVMPEPATVRSEEFINAFDYRDSEPPPGVPIAFAWERARYPFAHNRDLLRFSVKTAAEGRQAGRALNLVLLLDNSGSMERADRVGIVREALRAVAGQLQPQDKLSVIAFARTSRLWADGVAGDQAAQVAEQVSNLTPQGGTNLEDAMNLAYQTALRHYVHGGVNRVVLLTDGAANLGNVNSDALKQKVEAHRKQGIALDCFGIGWEGYNDDLLEVLSRNGDGRYGFINTPEEATTGFAGQLAGALRVAASDVKVQVEFNPKRVAAYRQIGYAKHQLTQEQFRDNSVDAAEIGAAESGNALYVVEVNPRGEGLLAVVRVRYKVPGTVEYHEHEWTVPYTGNAVALEQASSAMRLAVTASAFSEWLVASPYAVEVTPDRLLAYLSGVPEVYGIDPRPKKLEWMIRQAKSVAGR